MDYEDGIYYEDLAEGDSATTPGRTITETDIVNFAGISGDFNRIHTDEEFAANMHFGQRIAHGMLGLSVSSGLVTRNPGAQRHMLIAWLGLTWDFKRPILIGDTIRVIQTVKEKRPTRKPDAGLVIFDIQVINQRGKICQAGEWKVMYMRREEKATETS